MSDTRQGPDWYLADDGKWYPPRPMPVDVVGMHPRFAPRSILATAVAVFVGMWAFAVSMAMLLAVLSPQTLQ